MEKDKLNISSIEIYFDRLLKNKLSPNVFYTSLPKAMKSSWNEMVLVDIAGAIDDLNAYGYGIVNVFLYTKSMSNGQKNVGKLKKLEDNLDTIIDGATDSHYSIQKFHTFSDYDERRDLFCNIVALRLLIV